jgi:hypothetical protein
MNDLAFISDDTLIEELMRRFDCAILHGIKHLGDNAAYEDVYTWHFKGSYATAAGLAEMAKDKLKEDLKGSREPIDDPEDF